MKDPTINDSQEWPVGICLTEFHLAIFYRFNVRILCLLNKELVLNQKFDSKVTTLHGSSKITCFFQVYNNFKFKKSTPK